MKKAELKKLKTLNESFSNSYDTIEGLSYGFEMALTDDELTSLSRALNTMNSACRELTNMVEAQTSGK